MEKWDAIVIGAGNGGLAAAAFLAKEGKRTLLIERHNLPGGFATSFKRGRFEFEASLHELCGFGKNAGEGDVRRMFEALGIADKIEWADIPGAYRLITLDDKKKTDAAMPFGVEAYIEKMEEYVPGSKPSMKKLFALAEDIAKTTEFFGSLKGHYTTQAVKEILKNHLNFVRTAGYSVNDVLAALKVPKSARDIFNAYWCYLGVDCDEVSFIHYISMVRTYLTYGAVIPKARSHGMSSAILDAFESFGGEVWFNSHVSKINIENGRAKSVTLLDGTRVYADHIICNASPHNVFGKMIDQTDVPDHELKRANSRKFGARGLSVFLGLNKTADELGIEDHSYFIYNTVDSKKQYELMKKIETNDVLAAVCLNRADPDCSPKGTSILYFTTLYTDDAFRDVTAENYFKTKQAIADRMIINFERALGIKIRDSIEEIEIATPMTYARYTDTPQGVIYGYEAQGWDGVVPRIMMEGTEDTIPGLRFAGGCGTQLSGYSSTLASGRNAAYKTLNDMEKEAEL
jgi:prolycopene isomerase